MLAALMNLGFAGGGAAAPSVWTVQTDAVTVWSEQADETTVWSDQANETTTWTEVS